MKENEKTARAVALIMVLIFLGLPSMILAKELCVDASRGDDSNPRTLEKPFQTIQHAASEMSSGDVDCRSIH